MKSPEKQGLKQLAGLRVSCALHRKFTVFSAKNDSRHFDPGATILCLGCNTRWGWGVTFFLDDECQSFGRLVAHARAAIRSGSGSMHWRH
jgi:hypothetical protein